MKIKMEGKCEYARIDGPVTDPDTIKIAPFGYFAWNNKSNGFPGEFKFESKSHNFPTNEDVWSQMKFQFFLQDKRNLDGMEVMVYVRNYDISNQPQPHEIHSQCILLM